MKLTYSQLLPTLKKQLQPIYWLHGDEPVLIEEARIAIMQQAKANGFLEKQIFYGDDSNHLQALTAECMSFSIFQQKKVIELIFYQNKFTDAIKKFLADYCKNTLAEYILVIVSPKLDTQQLKTKWLTELLAYMVQVPITNLNQNELMNWLKQKIKNSKIQLSPECFAVLLEFYEGNLLALNQFIETLALADSNQVYTPTTLLSIIDDSARYDLFKTVDALLLGEHAKAKKMLSGLRAQNTEVILLLWALQRELRTIVQVTQTVATGQSMPAALEQASIWSTRKSIVQKIALKKNAQQWLDHLYALAHLDLMIKGMVKGCPWQAIEAEFICPKFY